MQAVGEEKEGPEGTLHAQRVCSRRGRLLPFDDERVMIAVERARQRPCRAELGEGDASERRDLLSLRRDDVQPISHAESKTRGEGDTIDAGSLPAAIRSAAAIPFVKSVSR